MFRDCTHCLPAGDGCRVNKLALALPCALPVIKTVCPSMSFLGGGTIARNTASIQHKNILNSTTKISKISHIIELRSRKKRNLKQALITPSWTRNSLHDVTWTLQGRRRLALPGWEGGGGGGGGERGVSYWWAWTLFLCPPLLLPPTLVENLCYFFETSRAITAVELIEYFGTLHNFFMKISRKFISSHPPPLMPGDKHAYRVVDIVLGVWK